MHRLLRSASVAGASDVLVNLMDVLCEAGADAGATARAAAVHEERRALEALIRRGVRVDLALAAALHRFSEFVRLLPVATGEERHLAFAVASQYGGVEMVRMLLDAWEYPNRYNPVGGHSHGTPLHQTAGFGYLELVRLLVERGGQTDWKDVLWGGTPEDWARHEGRVEVAESLREVDEAMSKATADPLQG